MLHSGPPRLAPYQYKNKEYLKKPTQLNSKHHHNDERFAHPTANSYSVGSIDWPDLMHGTSSARVGQERFVWVLYKSIKYLLKQLYR